MLVGQETVCDALWKGRQISYRPGLLHVALKRGASHREAYNILVKAGCVIRYDSFVVDVFEVEVPQKETLRLAGFLSTNSLFRYVEPDIVEAAAGA